MTLQQNSEKSCLITFTNFQNKKIFLKKLLSSLTTKGQHQTKGQFSPLPLNSRNNIQSIVEQLFQKQSQANDTTFFITIQKDKSVQIHFENTNTEPVDKQQNVAGQLNDSLLHEPFIPQINSSLKKLIKSQEDNSNTLTISKRYSEKTIRRYVPVQKLNDSIEVNFPITIYFEGYTDKRSFTYTFPYNNFLERQQLGVPTNFLQRVIERINKMNKSQQQKKKTSSQPLQ
jgi:hypothetical protein